MAASAKEVDWASCVKPLLSASYSSFNKNNIPDLADAIIKSEDHILVHETEYECFYSSFVALATHYISASVGSLSKLNLNRVVPASKVLLRYLLARLKKHEENCAVSQKYLMVLVKSLCKGSSSLPKSDLVTFTAVLKSAKTPPNIKTATTDSEEITDSNTKELQRPRLDTGRNIFSQLTSVFEDIPSQTKLKSEGPVETVNTDGDTTIIHIADTAEEVRSIFANRNIATLQQLNGGDVLLDVCMELVYLERYRTRYQDAIKGREFVMPAGVSEAMAVKTSLQNVLNDISIVWRVFSLPVLEPMSPSRLEKIVIVAMSCLYAAITTAMACSVMSMATGPQTKSANGKEEDGASEGHANSIVQKSLEIYNQVSQAIRTSTRAGGHNLQNFHMLGAWCLLKGLQHLLTLSPATFFEKGKEPVKSKQGETPKAKDPQTAGRPSSAKGHQGFGILAFGLASQTITLLISLMEDLTVERLSSLAGGQVGSKAADLNMAGQYTAIQRVRKIMESTNLISLLYSLIGVAYRKASSLKKQKPGTAAEPASDSASSTSESNTYYEDDFSSSEDSSAEDDDDSEPILGQWFEETLSPEEPVVAPPPPPQPPPESSGEGGNNKHSHRLGSSDGPNYSLPDKRDPEGFYMLASRVLQFLNTHFINSTDEEVQVFVKTSLTEQHMSNLASVIKDLDRDSSRVDEAEMQEFSQALSMFTHCLVATGVLSETLQDAWLTHLGVSPSSIDPWPLTVFPRTLAVLAEILLLRQQRERESGSLKCPTESAVINIWKRFIITLKNATINFDSNVADFEDLNVEHVQLLLFLFHSLTLMQRKTLLLQIGQCLVDIVANLAKESVTKLQEMIPLPLSRLVLLFDYLLHNFYDPPAPLMDQVQWNLFGAHARSQGDDKSDSLVKTHFPCREVEENYLKNLTSQEAKDNVMKPRFYNLGPSDYSNQDSPKVDGLACSFILGNPDILNYNNLYNTCVTLLIAGSCADKTSPEKFSLLASSSVHYNFVVCWRLLSCLPPSAQFLQAVDAGTVPLKDAQILHMLRWVPRLAHKAFSGWTKDSLVKQGLTTQKAEALVSSVVKNTETVVYDVKIALKFIQEQLSTMSAIKVGDIVPAPRLPSVCDVYMLDAVLAKIHVVLDDLFTKSVAETDPFQKSMDVAQDLLPVTFKLIEAYTAYTRSCLLNQVSPTSETPCSVTPQALQAYGTVMSIGSSRASKVSVLGMSIMGWLPSPVRNIVEKWNSSSVNEFPAVGAWRNAFANDILPVENYMEAIQVAHMSTLSGQSAFTLNASLKHTLQALVRFCGDLIVWCPDENRSKEMVRVLFPLIFDATTEYIADFVTLSLERSLGPVDGEEFTARTYQHVITQCYDIIINHSSSESSLDERVLHDCLKFMENHLEKPAGKHAFEKFFTEKADLVSVLLSAASENLSPVYGTKVLKVFNKLFQLAEKNPTDKSYESLCASLGQLAKMESKVLQNWLSKMIMGPLQSLEDGGKMQENRLLLQSLTTYIVKENSHIGEEVAKAILMALIPMGSQILSPTSEGIGFAELMVVMATLAGAGSGSGHVPLFQAATEWLELCKTYLAQKNVIEKLQENVTTGKHQTMLESACYLLSYIGDILGALKQSSERPGASSPPYDGEVHPQEADSDWAEDIAQEEEDSAAEDSDEESLNNKLCTFTITQKEFMNQHWYHCHTCKMVDGVGVCSVCAKVCHKDHDLSYAKYGSFFCDCGEKEDGSCQAMVKRSSHSGLDSSTAHHSSPSPFSVETMLTSSLRRRLSSPSPGDKFGESSKFSDKASKAKEALCKQIEGCKDALFSSLEQSNSVKVVLDLLQSLMPTIAENYNKMSPMGSTVRAQKALQDLKVLPKTVDTTDQLMTATLGSQEGAFENVRMNYSGDQGQTIRQLITSHVLRRVAMCCLTSPHGKRQHLAVSHEKGKITILQLSALLKQADSSKRKLTLTRLASAPIPFTVLSVTGNPCNEDFLAVCGLKDCHVLTFTSSGSVADHLVLHPSLETGNFIIKALWLPGSQTELAIVTADFVKIYDLSQDAISPQYYFLLPSGKIRDATFLFTEEARHMLLMSSSGYIYTQPMEESSHAKHGPFYITNILDVKHADIKESGGQIAGGGVSIYYSHTLQLLFFSYSQGKAFAAGVPKEMEELPHLFPITFKSSNGGKSGSSPQPLVQWTEVANHPGLVCSMTQSSNNPVILMVKPDAILVQEIKVLPAKAKIQDMVAIRHTGSNSDQRTTLILLCEDGSLRIYMANVETTNYWMSPTMQPQSAIAILKPVKKKKTAKTGRPQGQISFPVDFFEHCQQTNDIEFGGNDVLQVYNSNQVKHRLNPTGLYIASTKPAGFTIEISNTNNNNVMLGVRVLVGNQAIERAPSYFEIFGRTVQVNLTRARWYDMPFTREESLTADKKCSIFFGASVDPAGVTMVDSIKVYIKTKESFGWPEDTEDFPDPSAPKVVPPTSTSTGLTTTDSDSTSLAPLPLTSIDRLLASSLEVLDGCFAAISGIEEKDPMKQTAQDLATQLLMLTTPSSVQQHTKSLLSSLHSSRMAYHAHKDQAQLAHVMQCLSSTKEQLDADAYQRLVVTARSVAVARPANLVKFAEKDSTLVADSAGSDGALEVTDLEVEEPKDGDVTLPLTPQMLKLDPVEQSHFMVQLLEAFLKLHTTKPCNPMLAPACLPGKIAFPDAPGLTHVEATVGALVEVIHAFTACDAENINLATKLYVGLLLNEDPVVSFACKQAMIRVLRPRHRRRRVFIPSPPRCSTPGGAAGGDDDDDDDKGDKQPPPTPQEGLPAPPPHQANGDVDGQYEIVEPPEPMVLEPPEASAPPQPSPLEALLAGGGSFPAMLDIPPDADDETMVELAIALSLQDQPGHAGGLSLQGLHLGGQSQGSGSLETGHLSDTTASAPGSDDEVGSTAATDGSTLRTSPAEHGGSAGSESGGSAVDSISMSGRSSAYGDNVQEGATAGVRSETSSLGMPSSGVQHEYEGSDQAETDIDTSYRLHGLRLQLLERMIHYLPHLADVGGVRAIPFMQVTLMLTSDLDSEEEKDKAALDSLLTALLAELNMRDPKNVADMSNRNSRREVQLILMRLLSVFMSRTKAGTKPSGESSSFVSSCTASAMLQSGALDFCLQVLKILLDFWKTLPPDDEGSVLPGQLLKPHPTNPPPDMSPFFLRQYVKGHAGDVFEAYPQLLTEMVLRLPYQMKKIADNAAGVTAPAFDQAWFQVLCEYMMTQQTPFVRRQVRKLLLFVCGSKEKYRQLRDMHSLETHMKEVRAMCNKSGLDITTPNTTAVVLPYDMLINLIEHLKACSEVATSRTVNWQRFCQKDDGVLPFLIQGSIALDEGVAPVLLQLLQCALCGTKVLPPSTSGSTASPAKQKKEKEKEKDEESVKHDESLCLNLVQQVCKSTSRELLMRFIRCFLLESNSTSVRWQAHALVLHIYRSSSLNQQEALLDLMWSIWPDLPMYGRKASQFVDLLGYFALKTPQTSEKKSKQYVERAVAVLKGQNQILSTHPNGSIYNMLQGMVDFDGFYLESDPCLVCNNPEVPYANIKLSAIKVDSKFTTTTQIVKLVGSHNISKVSIRISDLKRTKMVRTINIYYNNRSVQAVVELKNKPGMWHKAKKVVLTAGQTEVKVEFPLPIIACNLMIEYADFYDNFQASAETLQCPRCSASVPANPGVCGNCGENVFQCHKCRSINYDEKDPFLCNACGFCKYAKFDFTLTAKPCCAVDPIDNDEDRKKAVSTVNALLEKADRLYKQLQLNRPALEALLIKINEHGLDKMDDTPPSGPASSSGGSAGGGGSNVNRAIQQLAQRYCGDCKSTFDELSKIIQKVLASRKELVEYDRQQREAALAAAPLGSTPTTPVTTPSISPRGNGSGIFPRVRESPSCEVVKPREKVGRCYGCSSATVEHCITLLRAMATSPSMRQVLCGQGLIRELIGYNMRRGTPVIRADVRQLLCLLTRDNRIATEELNNLLMVRIITAIKGHLASSDFAASVRHEILLLATTLQREDCCWEQRTRCVMKLFLLSMRIRSPVVLEYVALPCLRILQGMIKPELPTSKKNKEKTMDTLATVKSGLTDLHVDLRGWLISNPRASYQTWKKNMPLKALDLTSSKKKKDEKQRDREWEKRIARVKYLMEKYGYKWLDKVRKGKSQALKLVDNAWLRTALFSASSRSARQTACNILDSICQVPARRQEVLNLLTGYLDELGQAGESSAEFLSLYKRLIGSGHWKFYLAVKGVLPKIGALISREIDELTALEETTLSSDLSQGYALKALTELLAAFIEQENIKQHYKNRLVGTVLNGYLSLRKLVVQRTKLIDETQDKLLELLEEMTTGTESETKEFMAVCVETVARYPQTDLRSPVFIFERLCSIIYPEENDVGEFFLSLEKDPQQEDFLQGRMLGNPYSSNEPGLGPLMRDVKNKICQDCELVALLEDDTGMELLVNNKIISLDLPVKDVYKKVWVSEHGEGEPMRIVYRMRGLLGDATEDMVNSLDTGNDEDVDNEEVYKMANIMSQCGGLYVMLQRLAAIRDLVSGKQLMLVLLKLFGYCVKVKSNRQQLIKTEMNTISIMLGALNLALLAEQESGAPGKGQTLTEQILQIMEVILMEASSEQPEKYKEFSKLCGDTEQLMMLLDRINSPFVRANTGVLQALMRLIPFLAFGDQEKMLTLINHFKPYLNCNKYDFEHTQDEQVHLDCFCVIANGIEKNANGQRLKDLILESSIVKDAVEYIQLHAPPIKTLLATDQEDWKEFISKPSLPYILRLLTGMVSGHEKAQNIVGKDVIPVLHKLEQVSSDEHVGSMAENLMEALKENKIVSQKIEEIRQQTKAEKKRLAMAMRQKQLGALGMTTNEKGQVTVKSSVLKQMEELKEETGLTCCICREGYRYQPTKVLGIYTFTKRVNLDDFESKQRKTQGYSTVSHFNVVHIDCHLAAVRHARVREEWDSAALQNANTKCNGLLPLWGAQVPESAFASCLARHNTYLQECTGVRDASYSYTVHDLKHLMLKFAFEKSFSEDSGGGGRQSNVHLVPYLMHMALYVLNTTRSVTREEKNINNFLKAPQTKWVESSFEVEGPLYWTVMAVLLHGKEAWRQNRVQLLQRGMLLAHSRHVMPAGGNSLSDKVVKEYNAYKPYLLFFALADSLVNTMFKKLSMEAGGQWSVTLAEYIRHNDSHLLEQGDRVLRNLETEVTPCESFDEYCDVLGLLEQIPNPGNFLADVLASLPQNS